MDKKLIGFPILLFISILFLFTFLSPKISSVIYPFKRQALLKQFLSSSIAKKTIDPREFWQFRDFYYPGTITLERKGLPSLNYEPLADNSPIVFGARKIPFLHYASSMIDSYELLLKKTEPKLFSVYIKDGWTILLQNENEAIVENEKEILVVFVKPVSEMIKANGYLDYKDRDKKLLENKKWFVITKILK